MTNALTAVVRRVMPARPERVYDEWLDPDALVEWMCPRPAFATAISLDAKVGGAVRIDIDDLGTLMTVSGRYLELRRPERIRFTWHCTTWPPEYAESVVTVTFEPHGGEETLMTISHERLAAPLVDQHHRGWLAIAAQLESALRRGSALPGGSGQSSEPEQ
jgi:uncharacterized protein YndB with AHSA1/START domain